METKTHLRRTIGTRQITIVGMLSAICIFLGISGLGFIPIPPVRATIMHIPVIIGAILEGPLVGACIGLIFGVFSVIQAITQPSPVSFIFMNPLVSVLPRILIGITSYYVYKALKVKKQSIRIGVGAAIGTLTNTIGVLGMIYLIYLEGYAKALKISTTAAGVGLVTVGLTNGIPEIIISIIVTISVVMAVKKIRK